MKYAVPPFPRGIRALVIATVAVWIVQLLPGIGPAVSGLFALVPCKAFGGLQLWRLCTYAFLHEAAGPFHILFNMLTLWMFGTELEDLWGTRRFVVFYLAAATGSGLFSVFTALSPVLWFVPVIGASGAVLALLTVYALYFPRRQMLLFFLFPVNVLVAVAIFGAISLFGSFGAWGNVSHLTHLGGIAVGFFYVKFSPYLKDVFEQTKSRAAEARRSAKAAGSIADKTYFETVVDPILKKISEHGMDSLSGDEKRTLDEASRRRKKDVDGSGKVLPFRRR
jgi:membrane associated rhomboid family serine protease